MVEGIDDEHVVKNICGSRNIGKIDHIYQYGGKDPLIDGINVRLKESEISKLGIILDADTDLEARWTAVRTRLSSSGYENIPERPASDGTIIQAPENSLLPRVGIWLMPDNQVPGILEDFLHFLIPEDDILFAHVNDSMQKIPEGQRKFTELKESKARIHTWLAWQEEPGKPYGQAISARYLDLSLPKATEFTRWLQNTFFS
ncbi:MAG: DUF3226 domain-containing protein [Niveispirillum sp.]|uniref:DUF3226 domain-containing protein n=1 Tax=Niveispirillum sp. TaxID=1917217 RepID=UPI003BA5C0CF